MREIPYKDFSFTTHKKNWQRDALNVCKLELTFKCGLHCRHCYSDCYNRDSCIKEELKTQDVKYTLDKLYASGIIWLCFTGGDPLTRNDFLDIYTYAKTKGFIISIFSNGYSMTETIAAYLQKTPPFSFEITLNAVTRKRYEEISQVKGSFGRTMAGIDMLIEKKLPLKIKTQITQQNFDELKQIEHFIIGLRLKPTMNFALCPRLNGDLEPTRLRIPPEQVRSLKVRENTSSEYCKKNQNGNSKPKHTGLFLCAIDGDGIHIDPYGNAFPCNLIRKPNFNLLKTNIELVRAELLSLARGKKFTTSSGCRFCNLRQNCLNCPGNSYLETGDQERPVDYYCKLAKEVLHVNKMDAV
ncbi:MAG: radical SAM protein [Candidatus Omnitrophota bacterium]